MKEESKEFKKFAKNVKRKILRKNIVVALISVIGTLVILVSGYYYLAVKPIKVIPLENIEYKLYKISDGRIYLAVKSKNGYNNIVLFSNTVDKSKKMTISLKRAIIEKKSNLKQYIGYTYMELNNGDFSAFDVETIYYGDKLILDVNKNITEASEEIEEQILDTFKNLPIKK